MNLTFRNPESSLSNYRSKYDEYASKINNITDPETQQAETDIFDASCQQYSDLCEDSADAINKLGIQLGKLQRNQSDTVAQSGSRSTT